MKKIRHLRIKIIFIFSTILLLSLSIFSYLRINNLVLASTLVNHSSVVKLEIESLFSEMKSMESAQRGYVLTKNIIFLNQFNNTITNVSRRIKEIRNLTADNDSQQRNVDTLILLSHTRIKYMQNIVKVAEYSKVPTEKFIGGKESMDDLRNHMDKMINEEDFLLRLRTKSLTEETAITPLFTISLMICSILILIISYWAINRELKISNQLQTDLERHKSELLETNQSLLESNESLAKANKELESFTYISSHDLQEPLRKIQTFITRIIDKESDSLSESGRKYLNRTQESANRMQTLIRDLLAYSRLNIEIFPIEATDLNVLIDEIKSDFNEEIAEKKFTIEINSDHKPKIIISQFRQLLMNLISNSIKFSDPAKKAQIIIENTLVKRKDLLALNIEAASQNYSRIVVRDNGIGFDRQYKNRIFEVFQRLHIEQKYAGTGIGLAIVKKIVDNHNGYITADGEPGKGAIFTIYIPV